MFFSHEEGITLIPFGITHILTLLIFVLVIILLYKYRKVFKESKYEPLIRYGFAAFMLLWEIGLYIFVATSPEGWVWKENIPFGSLCGITLYIAIILAITKNYGIFEIGYFFTFGAIASLLFPDIPHSFDRYRYYQFMIGHAGFFILFMYMIFVHNFVPRIQSFYKSATVLFTLALLYIYLNELWDANFLFLKRADGTPFEMFEGHSQLFYIGGVFTLAIMVMYLWYLLARLYVKLTKIEI